MTTYHVTFTGRPNGAIGLFYRCEVWVEADSEDEAIAAVYTTHEHLSRVNVTKIDTDQAAEDPRA